MTARKRGWSKHTSQGALIPRSDLPKAEGELPLMRRILSTLRGLGIMAWRNHVGAAKIGNRFQRFGEPGSADLFAVARGRLIGIEVKRPGEKPTIEQAQWGKRLELAGGLYVVAHSTEEAVIPILEVLQND